MKKRIAILGSTGSIGKSLLKIISKNKKDFEVILLTANNNYKELLKQTRSFKVRNVIIINKKSFLKFKKINKNKKIKVFSDYSELNKIFKNKIDYVMSSITGIEGLEPTYNIIKFTRKIAIANKETLICAWNLILKELNKNRTDFIPVDSEHFSLWYGLKNIPNHKIEKIYLTASGGPLLNIDISKFKNIKLSQALKHPSWKMGKKISIDSCTMMNKVFEVIEAKHIFNLPYKKISILTHPDSYIHAIVKFTNGMIKIIAHDTSMEIPIFNTIYSNKSKNLVTKKLNLNKLNNLRLNKVNTKKFPVVNILKTLPLNISLFETVLVTINDNLVDFFLKKKIRYKDISEIIVKFVNNKAFLKYKSIKPKKIQDIISVKNHVSYEVKKFLKSVNV